MNTPKLRFKEFSGEWSWVSMNDISSRVTNKNKENNQNILTISAQYGLISQLDFFNKSVSAKDVTGYYLIEKNDFAYNKSYSNGYPMGAIKRLDRYDKGVVSTLYICFKFKDICNIFFIEQYFESGKHNKQIELYAQEGARNHGLLNIGINDFFSTELFLPSLPEQEKIASFFTAVDTKLSTLKKKKELLEQYKKGVMQKIFSQELRFKDENGQEFPNWEEKKLGEVLIEITEKSTLNNQEIVLSSTVKGIFKQSDYFNREIASSDNSGYKILKINQLVFSPQNIWLGNINVNLNFNIGIVSPSYKVFNFSSNTIPLFCNYFLKLPKILNEYKIASVQGASVVRRNLDMDAFYNINIELPSLQEQEKIAQFLSAIDTKIEAIQKQISQTELWKKGLLQKMFV